MTWLDEIFDFQNSGKNSESEKEHFHTAGWEPAAGNPMILLLRLLLLWIHSVFFLSEVTWESQLEFPKNSLIKGFSVQT